MATWWYDAENRGPRGPVLPDALKALADHGLLKPNDLVREDGTSEWVSARRLSGLFPPSTSPQSVESTSGASDGKPIIGDESEPMIPFFPFPAVSQRTEPLPSKPWQFSLKDILIAVALVAVACGAASLLFRFGDLSSAFGCVVGIIAISSLLTGAVGVLVGKPTKWFVYGGVAGVIASLGRFGFLFPIFIGTIVLAASRDGRVKGTRDPDQLMAVRQKSIYRLSAVCSVILLFLWMPIVFVVAPGGACRPMGQTLGTIAIALPITIVAISKALIQLVVEWPEEKRIGTKAIVAAFFPIAVYIFTQWLILSVRGISYED